MHAGLDTSALVVRLILAAIFATAAVAKIAGRRSVPTTLRAFGVPSGAAKLLTLLLPAAELAVAAALVPAVTARYGALAAAGLLAAFTGAVAYQLARGRRPDCNCFGELHSAPIGSGTLARNVILLAAAAFVAVHRAPALSAVAALVLLAVVEGALLIALLRRHGQVLAGLEHEDVAEPAAGLPVGSEAPEFELPDLTGRPVTLSALREDGLPVLLLFSDPACGPCSALLPDVGRWQQEHADELSVVLVSNGNVDDNRARAGEHGLLHVLSQQAHAVGLSYGANGTPMAVLVDVDGLVASSVAAGADAIRALVASVAQRASEEVLVHV